MNASHGRNTPPNEITVDGRTHKQWLRAELRTLIRTNLLTACGLAALDAAAVIGPAPAEGWTVGITALSILNIAVLLAVGQASVAMFRERCELINRAFNECVLFSAARQALMRAVEKSNDA